MSYLHSCVRCGAESEVGPLDDADDLCRDCANVDHRLSNGGHGLSGNERAAVAEFLGFAVGDDRVFSVDGRMNGMVWGGGDGFKDFDAVEPVSAFAL